jgi:hypothetical protein
MLAATHAITSRITSSAPGITILGGDGEGGMSSAGRLLCTDPQWKEDDRATVLQGRNGQAQATQELCRQTRVAQRDEHPLIPLCDMFLPALENIIRGCPRLAVSSSAIPSAHYLTAQIGCHDIELCHTHILNHRQPCALFSPSKQVGRAGPCPEAWKGG